MKRLYFWKMVKIYVVLSLISFHAIFSVDCKNFPLVINTWYFKSAAERAIDVLKTSGKTAIDSIVEGCSVCEREQCDGTVGFGGSPDENAETTLDALIFDGKTMNVGAVAAMRQIKDAIAVAWHVLANTDHTLLVGERATEFAVMMGFKKESLSTSSSKNMWKNWRKNQCQPNFWTNVVPNPKHSCGPYEPIQANEVDSQRQYGFSTKNHDTIGMLAIDESGDIAAGTSTNGAKYKIPGRVGDSPIPGSGAYADNTVGAAAATGDGDILMRFLPSFAAVEFLRQGMSPKLAGQKALKRISKYYPNFFGGIIVIDKNGEYGAACNGMSEFPYSIATVNRDATIETVSCA